MNSEGKSKEGVLSLMGKVGPNFLRLRNKNSDTYKGRGWLECHALVLLSPSRLGMKKIAYNTDIQSIGILGYNHMVQMYLTGIFFDPNCLLYPEET